jgi:hypothetical protein
MVDFLDSLHRLGADHVAVHCVPRFWDYLDEITPKILRNAEGVGDNFMGMPIREDHRCPPGQIWFFDSDGFHVGAIEAYPEPPQLCS